MRLAKKRPCIIKAYELGAGSPIEAKLKHAGKIEFREGNYLLHSLEGLEKAHAGDFFKLTYLEGEIYPYPNARDFFFDNHKHIEGDEYEQLTKPLQVWFLGEPIDNVMRFLLRTDKLSINLKDTLHCFRAYLWGGWLYADSQAVIVFYDVQHDKDGNITSVDFGLVNRKIFNTDYIMLN